jgi:hypothetical protein
MGPRKKRWVNFGLPDDRKACWFYPVIWGLVAFVFANLLDDPASDTKIQAITVLGLGLISLGVCSYWAFSLKRASVSVTDYIKGTTASRTMVWFWSVFGSISAIAPTIGVRGNAFVPLWDSALGAFAGIGAVILTAGPAYKEYREAIATVADTSDPETGSEQSDNVRTAEIPTDQNQRRSLLAPLLLVSLAVSLMIGRRRRRGSR